MIKELLIINQNHIITHFLSFHAITNVFYKHNYSNKKNLDKLSRVKNPTKANSDRHNDGQTKRFQ